MQGQNTKTHRCDVAIIGAGVVGIATAYYLQKLKPSASVVLLDTAQPMSLTSAQSGENYRNWWPHPIMTAFTDHSIDLMEELATPTDNAIQMNRRGYVLATRSNDVDQLMNELTQGYSELEHNRIRVHEDAVTAAYQKPDSADWQQAPSGVDVLRNTKLIQNTFPSFDREVKTVVHIRRAGAISAQQMGQLMLDQLKANGCVYINADVSGISSGDHFTIQTTSDSKSVEASQLVNAAGPFINNIANMLGTSLPVINTLQQKIAFEDTAGAIPRQMPFSIDLDAQFIDWTAEEAALLGEDQAHDWLLKEMPGAIHCRPDGGDSGTWVKLGWAFNDANANATREPDLQDSFPEIVLRGAARLNPSLKSYYGQLPRSMHHYGGYYTLTDENWPLVGPMNVEGAYVVGAMSGFGTMAACAAGDLCARWVLDKELPDFADALSLNRYQDIELMNEINALNHRGIL